MNPTVDVRGQPLALQRLLEIREQFAALQTEGRLHHATRIMLAPQSEKAGDVVQDWPQLLAGETTFGHSALRVRYPELRVQHYCFFGEANVLSQFTGLAAQAVLEVPINLVFRISPNPQDREARADRDQWLVLLYRLAFQRPGLLPVIRNLSRNGEGTMDGVDDGFSDPLRLVAAVDEGYPLNSAGRPTITTQLGRRSRYLYASLAHDVCHCSIIAIDHLVETWPERMKGGLPHDICDIEFGREAAIQIQVPKVCDDQTSYLGIKFNSESLSLVREGFNDVRGKTKRVTLSPIPGSIFRLLLRARGATVYSEAICNCWPHPPGQPVIQKEISRLRQKCKQFDLAIQCERGSGYRLITKEAAAQMPCSIGP